VPARPPPEGARVDYASLSLKDALDLAILVEKEARERYLKLSTMVGGRYTGDACDVFRAMADNEVKHETQLQAMRDKLFKRARSAVSRDALFDVEAPDWTKVNVFMSPRQAVEVALESEEKACEFYEAALPHVKDAAVRRLFEGLSEEERQHRAALRKKLKGLPAGPDLEPEFADEPGSDPG
jgi:rubrerythrin